MMPSSSHDRLDDYRESMISLARKGLLFRQHAARELIRGIDSHLDWEVMYHMIMSALNRQDADAVRVYVNDWSAMGRHRPKRSIFKWLPGTHFYALDDKFNTLDEAKQHLKNAGYDFGSLVERHVYAKDGD